MQQLFTSIRSFVSNLVFATAVCGTLWLSGCTQSRSQEDETRAAATDTARTAIADSAVAAPVSKYAPLDTTAYNAKVAWLSRQDTVPGWPVKAPLPVPGAVLPFKRIVAYYGNFYSKQMGILGEYEKPEMIRRLREDVKKWEEADPETPVVPAIHYIAVTAQELPQKDNTYRLRMPHHQIDTAINVAARVSKDALVFVDVQVGFSKVQDEIPKLEKYLSMPNVHLGIDPEFSMKGEKRPGKEIGTYDAADINYVTEYLAKLVREHNLPPKILVVHRFVKPMVTNYKKIVTRPEVQIVVHMDGWGPPAKKRNSYKLAIVQEPIQFAGFKVFYFNDTKRVSQPRVMSPQDMLSLHPQPIYIQYQ
jgi:hypothetical protein